MKPHFPTHMQSRNARALSFQLGRYYSWLILPLDWWCEWISPNPLNVSATPMTPLPGIKKQGTLMSRYFLLLTRYSKLRVRPSIIRQDSLIHFLQSIVCREKRICKEKKPQTKETCRLDHWQTCSKERKKMATSSGIKGGNNKQKKQESTGTMVSKSRLGRSWVKK